MRVNVSKPARSPSRRTICRNDGIAGRQRRETAGKRPRQGRELPGAARDAAVGLAQWHKARTEHAPERTRKMMIVVLAHKLLIALWRYTTIGEIPEGIVLRTAG